MKLIRLKLAWLILPIVWALLNLGLGIFIRPFHWLIIPSQPVLKLSIASLIAALLLEAFLFLAVFGLLNSLSKSKLLNMLARTLAVAFLSTYLVLLGLSWKLYSQTGVFLNNNMLSGFASSPIAVFKHTPLADLVSFIIAIFCALGFSIVFVTSLRDLPLKKLLGASLASLLCFVFIAILLPQSYLSKSSLRFFRHYTSHLISPNFSLFWSQLLPSTPSYQKLANLNCQKREAISDYLKASKLSASQKNIILIIVEALRADAIEDKHGQEELMPTLKRLAQQGISFPQVYAQSIESSYSKASIVTGLYPLKYEFRETYYPLDYPFITIYSLLKKAGFRSSYLSATSDKWQNLSAVTQSENLDLFFEAESLDQKAMQALLPENFDLKKHMRLNHQALYDQLVLAKLKTWIRTNKQSSFFSTIYLEASHFPYNQKLVVPKTFAPFELSPKDHYESSFVHYPRRLANIMRNRYFNTLNLIDQRIEKLLSFLESEQILDQTTIIITGDHGELFYEHDAVTHARYMYEQALRVPLIIWGSDKTKSTYNLHEPRQHIDLAPTIVELAGLPIYAGFPGESVFRGDRNIQALEMPRPLFATIQSIAQQDALIARPWKLISDHYTLRRQLFNLGEDPEEMVDLSDKHPRVLKCLSDTLQHFKNSQLSYYSPQNKSYREEFFPPRYYDLFAEIESCKG